LQSEEEKDDLQPFVESDEFQRSAESSQLSNGTESSVPNARNFAVKEERNVGN
jgi:hypothetical protein